MASGRVPKIVITFNFFVKRISLTFLCSLQVINIKPTLLRAKKWAHKPWAISLPSLRRSVLYLSELDGTSRFSELLSTEQPVSGISKARDNIAVVVQLFIKGGDIDINIRMRFLQSFHAFRSCNDAHEPDFHRSAFFQ